MPSPVVVLAHAPEAEAIAKHVGDQLSGLGYAVDRTQARTRHAQAAKIESAQRVVVLWTRAARGTPALRAAVRRASARGTLLCVSLDAAPPPTGARGVRSLPRTGAAWHGALKKRPLNTPVKPLRAAQSTARARRDSVMKSAAQAVAAPAPPNLGHKVTRAALALVYLAGLTLFVAAMANMVYHRDPGFAASVNALASKAGIATH